MNKQIAFFSKRRGRIGLSILVILLVAFALINIRISNSRPEKIDDIRSGVRDYCFQVEACCNSDDGIELEGWFVNLMDNSIDYENENTAIALLSTEDESCIISKAVVCEKKEVEEYFCGNKKAFQYKVYFDYASGYNADVKYSIALYPDYGSGRLIQTNWYQRDGAISHGVCDNDFVTDSEELNSVIRMGKTIYVNSSNELCFVQGDRSAYWIIKNGSEYDSEDRVRMLFLVYSSESEKLSSQSVEHGWDWDNNSFILENREITGLYNTVDYRVFSVDWPQGYPISYIEIGVESSEINWSEYIMPYYDVSK